MKLYYIRRTDYVYHDQFDSFVVRAENEEKALELCNKEAWDEGYFKRENAEITEVSEDGIEEVILGSFHAG